MPHEPASISPEVLGRVRAVLRLANTNLIYSGYGLQSADLRALLAEREALLEALEPSTDWLLEFAKRYSAAKDETSVKALAWNVSGAFRERAAAMVGGKG